MKADIYPHHCPGCAHTYGPIRTNPDGYETACCTCCHDNKGNRGPGRNDGRGW